MTDDSPDKPTERIMKSMQRLTDLKNRHEANHPEEKTSTNMMATAKTFDHRVNDKNNDNLYSNHLTNLGRNKQFSGIETGNPYYNSELGSNIAVRREAAKRAVSESSRKRSKVKSLKRARQNLIN